jgi:hypothetical protein
MTDTGGGPPWPEQIPPTVAQPVTPPTPPAGQPPATQVGAAAGTGGVPPTYPPKGRPPTPWYKQPWPYFVAAAVVLFGALLLYFGLRDDDDNPPPSTTTTTSAASTTTAVATTLAPTTTAAATTTAGTTTAPPTTVAPTTVPPTTLPATTTTTAPPTFTDGTHAVGSDDQDVLPGRYTAPIGSGSDCTWQRLSSQSGPDNVLGSGEVTEPGQAVLDVLDTDAFVTTSGCGTWTGYVAPAQLLTQMGAGQYVVGPVGTGQIAPGSYRTGGADGCTWSRLRAFTGDPDDVIASGTADDDTTVVLVPGDAGFSSTGCPAWNKS